MTVTAAAMPRVGWQARAVCRGHLDVFFPPSGYCEPPQVRRNREAAAKALCAACPVTRPCRAFARASHEAFGIWGGETEQERWLALHPGRQLPKAVAR